MDLEGKSLLKLDRIGPTQNMDSCERANEFPGFVLYGNLLHY